MTGQLELNLREHDLPPEWDSQPVEWETAWHPPLRMFICPPPEPDVCPGCGLDLPRSHKKGWLPEYTAWKRNGYGRTHKVRQRDRLSVFRCTYCRHDEVFEVSTGQWWALGPEDYGPRGSYLVDAEGGRQ